MNCLKSKNGFSLIELLLVIILMAAIPAAFIFFGSSHQSLSVKAIASKVAAQLNYAQQLAQNRHEVYWVQFIEGSSPTMQVYTDPASPTVVPDPVTGSTDPIDLYNVSLALGAKIDDGIIYYDTNGEPYGNGSIDLSAISPTANNATITLSRDGLDDAVVEVTPQTGLVIIGS